MKHSELKQLIKEEVIQEVSKVKLFKDIKSLRKDATPKENEFLDEIEANIGNYFWIKGLFQVYGDIHVALGSRLSPQDLSEILPLLKKYRMNIDSIYTGVNLPHSGMMLRLFYK